MSAPAAVVLLSGGLDSATVLAMAQADGYRCHCLSFAYGQRHVVELDAARRVAAAAGIVDHRIAQIDLRVFGGSALTDEIDVPKHGAADEVTRDAAIPVTYVPARNTIFLSFAVAFAEVVGSSDVFIGVNALDYSGYPDCRPEYIASFQAMANLATKAAVEGRALRVHTPLIELTKAQIISVGTRLDVDYGMTVSCYDPVVHDDGNVGACGRCDSCLLRARGFADAGVADPTSYG